MTSPSIQASGPCVVLITCGTQAEAQHIATTVVTERLAACVNLISPSIPIQSFYMWEGQLQNEPEFLLIMKTRHEELTELEARVKELHSYSVPEFIVLPVVAGSHNYLQWLRECVS